MPMEALVIKSMLTPKYVPVAYLIWPLAYITVEIATPSNTFIILNT